MSIKPSERIIDHVASRDTQDRLRSLPPTLVRKLHTGLNNVRRGQNSEHAIFSQFMSQTDLGHVNSMLTMRREITNNFPYITKGLNEPQIETQIITHDIGEPHPRIGDVASCGPDRNSAQGQRIKRYEYKVGFLLLGLIPDQELRAYARTAYTRAWFRDYRDPEAQLVQILDKMEGTTRGGIDGIYTAYLKLGYSQPSKLLIRYIELNLAKLLTPVSRLAPMLDMQGKIELIELVNREFDRVENAGYGESADFARQLVKPAVLSSRRRPQPFFPPDISIRELAGIA